MSWTMEHDAWCGPKFPLRQALEQFLLNGSPENAAFTCKMPTKWGTSDKLLEHRWNALWAIWSFFVENDSNGLDRSITEFDLYLNHDPQSPIPRPHSCTEVLDRFESDDGGRRIGGLLRQQDWTPATFLVYDLLCKLYYCHCGNKGPKAPPIRTEKTPILAVSSNQMDKDRDAVLDLVLEFLPGSEGPVLITPDLWAMGMIGFGAEERPEKSAKPNDRRSFMRIMHDAFRLTWNNKHGRLRWRLEPRSRPFPRAINGSSAEVAAACVARALASQSEANPGPLLDPSVAVTACLDEEVRDFGERLLKEVWDESIQPKFSVAFRAGLAAVLVADQQKPEVDRYPWKPQDERGSFLWIQRVSNLDQAYENLLLTSQAVADYKQRFVDEWTHRWFEASTNAVVRAE